MKNWLKSHWPQYSLVIAAAAVLIWAAGCPPRVRSPIHPEKKVTRTELHAELKYTVAMFESADLDLDEQERLREIILQNVLMAAQSPTVNPLAIVTGLLTAYGAGSAGRDTVRLVKRKKNTVSTPNS